jgi:hypothetical protein
MSFLIKLILVIGGHSSFTVINPIFLEINCNNNKKPFIFISIFTFKFDIINTINLQFIFGERAPL